MTDINEFAELPFDRTADWFCNKGRDGSWECMWKCIRCGRDITLARALDHYQHATHRFDHYQPWCMLHGALAILIDLQGYLPLRFVCIRQPDPRMTPELVGMCVCTRIDAWWPTSRYVVSQDLGGQQRLVHNGFTYMLSRESRMHDGVTSPPSPVPLLNVLSDWNADVRGRDFAAQVRLLRAQVLLLRHTRDVVEASPDRDEIASDSESSESDNSNNPWLELT